MQKTQIEREFLDCQPNVIKAIPSIRSHYQVTADTDLRLIKITCPTQAAAWALENLRGILRLPDSAQGFRILICVRQRFGGKRNGGSQGF